MPAPDGVPAMRCLLPLSLLLLAGCGKPAPPPDWLLKDAPEARAGDGKPAERVPAPPPPPALPAPGDPQSWNGLAVTVRGVFVLGGKGLGLLRLDLENTSGRAVDWPSMSGRGADMTVTDERGNVHPEDKEENRHSLRAFKESQRLGAAGGKGNDSYNFAAPPAGCGTLVFRLRMPDGAELVFVVPEKDLRRKG